jgi:hypothetical protein
MDWILFVFKRGFKNYLVADESEESAWESLASRQSMSVENCKKEYSLRGHMNGNSGIWKI